jgi:hypothetical protein
MMWKPYVISCAIFAVVYFITHDNFASYANGFVSFYLLYKYEQKSEQQTVANAEVGA